jgi:hypothetical protein
LFNQAMPASPSELSVSDYRLAAAFGARFVGGLLVLLAVVLLAVTVVVAVLDLPIVVLLGVGAVGIVGILVVGYVVTRRVPVVRLGKDGYRVRLVRGVGATSAGWREVEQVVTATPAGEPVLVLRLTGGRTTTIPVRALAADREAFARDLRAHVQRGQGLRPL